jgi:predicted nucleic acid-binding protein
MIKNLRVLLDTNIVLDFVMKRKEWESSAYEIMQLASKKLIIPCITANSFTDIFFILSRKIGEVEAKKYMFNVVIVFFEIIDITANDCINSLNLKISDVEDALQVICAQKNKIKYIITRDEKFINVTNNKEFEKISIKLLKPKEFLQKFNNNSFPS